ncbi:MAG: ATP-binding protein [Ignavibacteria bacterium]|jgi:PAS domain S-box-containing protein
MDKETIKILLFECSSDDAKVIVNMLKRTSGHGIVIKHIDCVDNFNLESGEDYDLILLTLNLHNSVGIEIFDRIHSRFKDIPIVVQTEFEDEELGRLTMSKGAQDFLVKGEYDSRLLLKSIQYSIERNKLYKKIHDEELLAEKEKIFKEIFENSPIGMYRACKDGKILVANKALVKILGYNSVDELKGKNIADAHVDPEERKKFISLIEKFGSLFSYEYKMLKKDNSIIQISENCRLVKNENNEALYYEGLLEDITLRKEAHEKIKEYNRELKQLNESKDKFFSIIAHDLRNPFNSLFGFIQMLIEEYNELTDEERIHVLKEMEESTKTSYQLLDNLLQWARSQSGKMEIRKITFNINEVVNRNIKLLSNISKRKNIEIINCIDTDIFINADEQMIDTVVRNLITNAIKFTNYNGEIKIDADIKKSEAIVCISDNGIGMRKSTMDNLFKEGYEISYVGTDNETGSGLGLLLCKEFISKNDGRIWVESKLGFGSKFYFSLPFVNI